MSKGWTEERRKKQAERLKQTRPWEKSTGPRTAKGRKISSMNAMKHGHRSRQMDYYARQIAAVLFFNREFVKHAGVLANAEAALAQLTNELKEKRLKSMMKDFSPENALNELKENALPELRGELVSNAPIGAQSWFGCGGSADLLFQPADLGDLIYFLQNRPAGGGYTVIGDLANTIVRDGGVRGVTIQPGKGLAEIDVDTKRGRIYALAGSLNGSIAAAAVKAGIGGLEFLSGIPGSFGGALRMNAGAYGTEIKDVLVEAQAVDGQGNLHYLTPETLEMGYRSTTLPRDFIFVAAVLQGVQEDYETVKARMNEIKAKRNDTQPIREKTGGSTFANPEGDLKAWQLVEKVGGRGLKIGGAQMSEKHCNFMINTGSATAADLEALGDELIRRVREDCGVELHWEIKRIGDPL